jgi:hypothetical protein
MTDDDLCGRCHARPIAVKARRLCRNCYKTAWRRGDLAPLEPAASAPTCPDTHPHNRHCFQRHRCRCAACLAANRAYGARRRRAVAYRRPTSGLVDAEQARAWLRVLLRSGATLRQVARLAGLGESTLRRILRPSGDKPATRRVQTTTRDKVMSVTKLKPAPGAHVPAIGSRRRVQALVCEGWSVSRQAALLGVTQPNFLRVLSQAHVRKSTHDKIDALYRRLDGHAPPQGSQGEKISAAKAVARARRQGWMPRAWWDDIDAEEGRP